MKALLIGLVATASSLYVINEQLNVKDNITGNTSFVNLIEADKNSELVLSLELNHSGLENVPENLERFTNLQSLYLSHNFIERLPVELKDLKSLSLLDLSNNSELDIKHSAQVLNQLSHLEELYMSNCMLSYLPFDFGGLNKLKVLDLSDNKLGELPYYMSDLTRLEYVNLNGNELKELGYAPSLWKNLKYIDLKGNPELSLASSIQSLSFLKKLKVVELDQVRALPENINELKTDQLIISNSSISGMPESFSNAQIHQLQLENCGGSDFESICKSLSGCEELEELSLIGGVNKLPGSIHQLHQLKKLDLAKNGLKKLELTAENFPLLEELNVMGNNLSDKELEQLQKEFPNLRLIAEGIVLNNIEKEVDPPIKSMQIPSENYSVVGNEATELEYDNSKIIIPENAFLDKEGNVVNGTVDIEYREFHDPVDIILSGIPMGYDTADIKGTLESAGMFEFRASSQGEEVFPNPDAIINVELESKQLRDGYNRYKFNEDSGNWEYEGVSLMQDSLGNVISEEEILVQNELPLFDNQNYVPVLPALKTDACFFGMKKIKGTKHREITCQIQGAGVAEYSRKFTLHKLLRKFKVVYAEENGRKYSKFLKGFAKESKKLRGLDVDYFKGYQFKIDKEKDRLNLVADYLDTTLVIPVNVLPRTANPERIQKSNARFWKLYKKTKTAEDKENAKIERSFQKALKSRDLKLENVQNTNRLNVMAYKRKFKPLRAVTRVLPLATFGIINSDCLPPLMEEEETFKRIELVAEHTNKPLAPTKVMVINEKRNSVKTYYANQVRFNNRQENSIFAILEDDKVGIIKSKELKSILKSKDLEIEIPLTIVDCKKKSITELKKMINS